MSIALKRAYEAPSRSDGCRILVDRLWPRGVTKENAKIELWSREVAPSNDLRRWYGHEPDKWAEFKRRYFLELKRQEESLEPIRAHIGAGPVTFVFSSKEERLNNAAALKEYLERSV